MEIDEPLMKEWIVRSDREPNAYTALPTTMRSVSMTKSMMSQQNAFLRKLSTQTAMKTINQGPEYDANKNLKAMEQLEQNKAYFSSQMRTKSV